MDDPFGFGDVAGQVSSDPYGMAPVGAAIADIPGLGEHFLGDPAASATAVDEWINNNVHGVKTPDNELLARRDAYRSILGERPMVAAGGNSAMEQYQQQRADTSDSFGHNISSTVGPATARWFTSLLGIVAPETAANVQRTADETYGVAQPGSAGQLVGEGVNFAGAALPLLSGNPASVPTMAAKVGVPLYFGAQALGGKREEVAQRRSAGENITPTQEWLDAGGQAVVQGVLSHYFQKFAGVLAGAPNASSLMTEGGKAAMANALAQVNSNLLDKQTGTDPNRQPTDGLEEAALNGFLTTLLVGGAGKLSAHLSNRANASTAQQPAPNAQAAPSAEAAPDLGALPAEMQKIRQEQWDSLTPEQKAEKLNTPERPKSELAPESTRDAALNAINAAIQELGGKPASGEGTIEVPEPATGPAELTAPAEGEPNAQAVRVDSGQPGEPGLPAQTSQELRGADLQQPAQEASGNGQAVQQAGPLKTESDMQIRARQRSELKSRAAALPEGTIIHGTQLSALPEVAREGLQPGKTYAQGGGSDESVVYGSRVKKGDAGVAASYAGKQINSTPALIELKPGVQSKDAGGGAVSVNSAGKSYVHPNDIAAVHVAGHEPMSLQEAVRFSEAHSASNRERLRVPGLRFDGLQEGAEPGQYLAQYTDPKTGSTFLTTPGEDPRAKLTAMREKFAAKAAEKPPAGNAFEAGLNGKSPAPDSATPTGGGSKYGRSGRGQQEESTADQKRTEGQVKREYSRRSIQQKLLDWLDSTGMEPSSNTPIHYADADGNQVTLDHPVIPPDALKQLEGTARARAAKFVNEDEWSNITRHMDAAQISGLEMEMLRRVGQTKADRTDLALELAKEHGDPRTKFLANYYENTPGFNEQVPKEWFNAGKLTEDDIGSTFEIHGEKFRVDTDEQGNLILKDHITIEDPQTLGKIPIDKGSLRDPVEAEIGDEPFSPDEAPAKTTGRQGSLLGASYEGSDIGSKTAGMFGDVSRGPASALEKTPESTAMEKKFADVKSGDLLKAPAADKSKGELDVGDKFPFPGSKPKDKYPVVTDVRMTSDGQRQYQVRFNEKNDAQWMPVAKQVAPEAPPGDAIGQRGLSEGPPGASQVGTVAKASAPPPAPSTTFGKIMDAAASIYKSAKGVFAGTRGRFTRLAVSQGPDIAQAFTRKANEPAAVADDAHRAFTRDAFAGDDELKARWWQLGQAIRGVNVQEKAQAKNPNITPEELDALWTGPKMTREEINAAMADPRMAKAAKIWNDQYSPALADIRQRNGLLMNPEATNRAKYPFFINMPTEFDGPAGTDTSARSSKAFNKKFGGTGNYQSDPDEGIKSIFRGHVNTDTTQALANLIRRKYSYSGPEDVLQANGYTAKIAGKNQPLEKIDLGPKPSHDRDAKFAAKAAYDLQAATEKWGSLDAGPAKDAARQEMENAKKTAQMAQRKADKSATDERWVPEEIAGHWNRLKNASEPRDTIYDRINGAFQRIATTATFIPHLARVTSLAASRMARTGEISGPKDLLRFLPSWLGSNERAISEAHAMNGKPWGETMQYLLGSWGANRGSGYGAEGETKSGVLNVGHRLLFDPESGGDILARRVVADTYLRQVLGNERVDAMKQNVATGKMSALEASRTIRQRLTAQQAIDAGQYVNGTLGFSNRRTRSGLLNAAQRAGVPFIGSESGMIPADIGRVASLNFSPEQLAAQVKAGRFKQASVAAAQILGGGAAGLYAAMNGLNYLNTMAQTGQGKLMKDNDEGHKNDIWLSPGVYLGNLDPSIARGERLTGANDFANTGSPTEAGKTAAIENVNEGMSVLAPHIKSAFEILTAAAGNPSTLNVHADHEGKLSFRSEKIGDAVPLIPNSVNAAASGDSLGIGIAKDAVKGLGMKLSTNDHGVGKSRRR